jgi:hypothetical protein
MYFNHAFEIEEAGHFSNNRIKWLNVVVIPVTDMLNANQGIHKMFL